MSERDKFVSPGLLEEAAKIKALHGQARLSAMWAVAQTLSAPGQTSDKIEWLKSMIHAAWNESRFDFKFRAFGELRKIYEDDSRFADLRKDVLWYASL